MDNRIIHKYGSFKKEQVEDYITKIRKKIFWLILYTDPETKSAYEDIDVHGYHENLMYELSGLNSLLFYPKELVEILSLLESALHMLESDSFYFRKYRRLVFDAGALVKDMEVGDKDVSL